MSSDPNRLFPSLSRRDLLQQAGCGAGILGLASLLKDEQLLAATPSAQVLICVGRFKSRRNCGNPTSAFTSATPRSTDDISSAAAPRLPSGAARRTERQLTLSSLRQVTMPAHLCA